MAAATAPHPPAVIAAWENTPVGLYDRIRARFARASDPRTHYFVPTAARSGAVRGGATDERIFTYDTDLDDHQLNRLAEQAYNAMPPKVTQYLEQLRWVQEWVGDGVDLWRSVVPVVDFGHVVVHHAFVSVFAMSCRGPLECDTCIMHSCLISLLA